MLLQPPACRIKSTPGADWRPGLLIIEEENLHNIKTQFFANFVKNWIKHMPAKPPGASFGAEPHWGSPACCFSDAQGDKGSTAAPLPGVVDMSRLQVLSSGSLDSQEEWIILFLLGKETCS